MKIIIPIAKLLLPLLSDKNRRDLHSAIINAHADSEFAAGLIMQMAVKMGVAAHSRYDAWCYGADGRLKWQEVNRPNLVVTAGLNELLDKTFKGSGYTAAWYVGLKDTGAPDAADTMGSHASWATITPYSNATDPALTLGSVAGGSVDNSASKAAFTINATDDVYGAFVKTNSTKGGTTGTLYGAADFSGARSVINGDTLNVQVTLTVS